MWSSLCAPTRAALVVVALLASSARPAFAQSAQTPAEPAPGPRDIELNLIDLPTTASIARHHSYFRLTHRFARDLRRGSFGNLAEDLQGIAHLVAHPAADGPAPQDCVWMRMGFEPDQSGLKGKARIHEQHPVVIRKALQYASMASGKLEIRDCEVEEINRKSDALYQLIKHLLNIHPLLQQFQGLILTLFPQLSLPGLTRVSLGIENSAEDVDTLIEVLDKIARQPRAGANNPYTSAQINVRGQIDAFASAAAQRVYTQLT